MVVRVNLLTKDRDRDRDRETCTWFLMNGLWIYNGFFIIFDK